MAGRPGETSRGHDISVVPQDRAVWLRSCVGEEVGEIWTGVARPREFRRGIAPSRVSPVIFSRPARGLRLVIGRLVPLIFVRNPDDGASLAIRETAIYCHLISPRFSVPLTTAVMQPVGIPHRVQKGHMHDRFPFAGWLRGVTEPARGSGAINLLCRIPKRVRIALRCHRIQEFRILRYIDFKF